MATLDTMDSDLAARMRQIAELRERAERAEAKLKEKPSLRVVRAPLASLSPPLD